MTRFAKFIAFSAASLLLPALGCHHDKDMDHHDMDHMEHHDMESHGGMMHMQADAKTAVAVIKPAKGAATQPSNQNVMGTVTFTQVGDGVKVMAHLMGLSPGKHGFHIHEKADFSDPALASAGGHWDPDGHKKHGGPMSEPDQRHAGDLGNIEAGEDGHAHLEETIPGLTVGDGGKHDIVGHAVVVHAKEDDMKDIKSSGGRVAAGAIEMKMAK